MKTRLLVVAASALLLVSLKCSESDCDRAKAEVEKACAGNPQASECRLAKIAMELACAPKPTPTPTVAPTPTPTPTPSLPANCNAVLCGPGKHCVVIDGQARCVADTPEPTPTPTPSDDVETACGIAMPEGVSVFVKAKSYGQGVDTELNVLDWPELCRFIHGNPVNPNQCHLEGLDSKGHSRVRCEMAIIWKLSNHAGRCPVPIWRTPASGEHRCTQEPAEMSCDHWGDTETRDDPNTPAFEGRPSECGDFRDERGDPASGYFWIGHGDGEMKACLPDYATGCSRAWLRVVH